MPPDSTDERRSRAVEQLRAFGLSTYAARTFVALVSIGEGTAKDVSGIVDVPRTRVYDAVEELHDRGLVDIQESTPRKFWAISVETAARLFHQEYTQRVHVLTEALEGLEPVSVTEEQRGVWTVTGRETVTDRLLTFIGEAEEEVVFMTVEELLTDEIVDRLERASDRGVTIKLGGVSEPVQAEIRETIPEADLFDSMWKWTDVPAGRLLLVDDTKTLVSVLVGESEESPEARDETAIWGAGETNSLVVVLKGMFMWRLEDD